jgi:hypothetical protein
MFLSVASPAPPDPEFDDFQQDAYATLARRDMRRVAARLREAGIPEEQLRARLTAALVAVTARWGLDDYRRESVVCLYQRAIDEVLSGPDPRCNLEVR